MLRIIIKHTTHLHFKFLCCIFANITKGVLCYVWIEKDK